MLGNYSVATQLMGSRVVLGSIELVIYTHILNYCCLYFKMERPKKYHDFHKFKLFHVTDVHMSISQNKTL
jgi:hypothetical protein